MKKLLFMILISVSLKGSAQVFANMGPGKSNKGLLGEIAVGYQYKQTILQTGYQSHLNDGLPALLQLRAVRSIQLSRFAFVKPGIGYCRYQKSSVVKADNSNSYLLSVEFEKFEMDNGSWYAAITQTKKYSIVSCGMRFYFGGGPLYR